MNNSAILTDFFLNNITASTLAYLTLILALGIIIFSSLPFVKFKNSLVDRVISGWCILVLLTHIIDYYELFELKLIKPLVSNSILTSRYLIWLGLVILLVIIYLNFVVIKAKALESISKYSGLLVAWLFGLILLLLPALLVFPSDSVITGVGVSNDSVHHAFLAKGYFYTRSFELAPSFKHGLENYPRAIHSLVSVFSKITALPTYRLILPVTILAYSFIVPVMFQIIKETEIKISNNLIALISILGTTPFLVSIAIYLGYFSHLAAIPIILYCTFRIINLNPAEIVQEFCYLSIPAATAIASYSLFPLLFFIPALIYPFYKILKFKSLKISLLKLSNLIILLIPTLAIYPAIKGAIILILPSIIGGPEYENLRGAEGIFPGFLDLIHLTGSWPLGQEFRSVSLGQRLYYQFQLLFLAMLILLGYAKNEWFKIVSINIALLFLASIMFGTYITFKLLVMTIPLITIGSVLGLMKLSRLLVLPYVFFLAYLNCYYPIRNHFSANVINSSDLKTLARIVKRNCQISSCLIYTKNDWIRVLMDQNDDFAPATQYLHRAWNGEKIDKIIIDPNTSDDFQKYLSSTQVGSSLIAGLNSNRVKKLSNGWLMHQL